MRLENKVALVTGGNGGLGACIVKMFVREGAKVAFCGRNKTKIDQVIEECETMGGDVLGIQCDVTNSADVKRMFQEIVEKYGTLDILVNNAAKPRRVPEDREKSLQLNRSNRKFSLGITRNMSDEEWLDSMNANLNSVFYCCREALNIMEPRGYGKIINIASLAGVCNRSPHSPNYSAAKGGVVAFTRSLAVEVIGAGVIVNAIAPGGIATKYISSFANENESSKIMLQDIPIGRLSTPEEQASVVLFLASDESNYIVGQTINVNGGIC